MRDPLSGEAKDSETTSLALLDIHSLQEPPRGNSNFLLDMMMSTDCTIQITPLGVVRRGVMLKFRATPHHLVCFSQESTRGDVHRHDDDIGRQVARLRLHSLKSSPDSSNRSPENSPTSNTPCRNLQEMFTDMMMTLVDKLHDWDWVVHALEASAIRHLRYGVSVSMFPAVGQVSIMVC